MDGLKNDGGEYRQSIQPKQAGSLSNKSDGDSIAICKCEVVCVPISPSRYLILLLPAEEERTVLFHSVHGTIAAINCRLDKMQDILDLPRIVLDQLISRGFVVSSDIDETSQITRIIQSTENDESTLRLSLITSYACNLKCPYCFVPPVWAGWSRKIPTKTMSNDTIELIIKFIDSIQAATHFSRITVDLVGLGEPLLYPDIIVQIMNRIADYAHSANINSSFLIISNGTLITEDILLQLKQFRPVFQISIDGDRSHHNKQRPFKSGIGSYDRIMTTLNYLALHDVAFSVRINVTENTITHLDGLLADLKNIADRHIPISLAPVIPASADANASICRKKATVTASVASVARKASCNGFTIVLPPVGRPTACNGSTKLSYAIDMFGDVYPCEGVVGNLSLRLGTLPILKHNVLTGGWGSNTNSMCIACTLLPACGGICPSWKHFGFPSNECNIDSNALLSQIKLYLSYCYPDWFEITSLDTWSTITNS